MKKNKSKESAKISLYCEGKMEQEFIFYLKSNILKINNISFCKKHTKSFNGGFRSGKIEDSKNCFCDSYVIIDCDNKNDSKINNIKNIVKNNLCHLIINYPSIEIVFLSFFKEINKTSFNLKELESELSLFIGKKYKHTSETIELICNKINSNKLTLFENNLNYLKENKISNFIDLYKKIKGY